MLSRPFRILSTYDKHLQLDFLVKTDNVRTDADIARVTGAERIASVHQMHGSAVVVVREPTSRTLQADGLITDVPGLTLTIRFADCQGLIVSVPKKNIVGLIHAGWRGIVAGVIPSFFTTLDNEWGIKPAQALVAIGPSLCMTCAEFSDPATEVPTLQAFTQGNRVDFRAAADRQLRDLGVQQSNIERSPDCTRCQPEQYWTYRGGHREDVKNGYTNCFAVRLLD